ncbi:MAG: TonB-dependent receptor [Gemmatimonadota bacterium]|nr:TonB-dependent receptor [Gemmatimonadota bacterium]
MTVPLVRLSRIARGSRRVAWCAQTLVALTATAAPLVAQLPTGSVRGLVLGADGDSLRGATISVPGRQTSTTSDEHGRFTLTGLTAGPTAIRVRALGHRAAERLVTVVENGWVDVVFRLETAPVALRSVRTEAADRERLRFRTDVGASSVAISGATIAAIPAVGEPDVLRAVQLLPGVLARNDFSAGYNVRGGESDQNLILLDGIPIYNPFHLGGLFGMFMDETVGDVQLLTGGFPVTYGGRLSSVLDVTSAEETRPGIHGTVNASLLSSSVALGGGLASGNGSWNVGARRTYADLVASAFSNDGLPYHFQDAQVHATRLLPSGGTLSLTGYAGQDILSGGLSALGDSVDVGSGGFRANLSAGDYHFDWGNQLLGLTLQQPIGPGSEIPLGGGAGIGLGDSAWLVQRASVSHYSTTLGFARGALEYSNRVTEERLAGSLRWHTGVHAPTLGYEFSQFQIRYGSKSPRTQVTLQSITQSPSVAGVFLDDRWQPAERLLFRYGVRAEHVTGAGWSGVSPRGQAKLFLTRDLALTAAAGRYTQWIHGLRNEDVPLRVFDFWIASDKNIQVTKSQHFGGGLESWRRADRFVRVEGFYKNYDRLYEPNPSDDPAVDGDEFVATTGKSYGLDLYARQLETGPLSGWLAYTFTVSRRTRDGVSYAPAQDRTHNLNVVTSYRTASRWLLGAHFALGTGTPYTNVLGQTIRRNYDGTTNSWDTGTPNRELVPVEGERNGARYPLFHRLDLSASRSYGWRGTVVTPSLQIVNAYNRHNVFTYNFDYAGNPPTRQAISQFPILPTIGVRVEF